MRSLLATIVGVLALSGCASAAEVTSSPGSSTSVRNVEFSATFSAAPGPATTYDRKRVPVGARGVVTSTSGGGNTTVKLELDGLKPNRRYGAHAHTEPCGATGEAAGPHFQYTVDPVQPSVDPRFTDARNEIWLDLVTDPGGAGLGRTTVPWEFPADRRPRSVVVHAETTATGPGQAGQAGERVACLSVPF